MQELPPGEAPESTGGQAAHALPRLRLSGPPGGESSPGQTPDSAPPGSATSGTVTSSGARRSSRRPAPRLLGRDGGPAGGRGRRAPRRLPVDLAFAVASGALLSLANPPVQVGPLAFVSLVPLLHAMRRAPPRRGLLLGFAFGFTYFGLTLSWILLFGKLAWGSLS